MAGSAIVGTLRAILASNTAEFRSEMKQAAQAATSFGQDMKRASAEVKAAGAQVTPLQAGLTRLGRAFTVAAAAAAVKHFSTVASDIKDLADRTGLSVKALQEFKFAAEQTGATMEDVSTAITQMNNRLSDGDKSTLAALSFLNLELAELQAMQPEDAFAAIAAAIAKVPDPMKQSQLALDLFARGGAKILPMVKDLEALREKAQAVGAVMSDETVKAGDALGDQLGQLGSQVTALLGTGLTPLLMILNPIISKMTEWGGKLAQIIVQAGDFKRVWRDSIETLERLGILMDENATIAARSASELDKFKKSIDARAFKATTVSVEEMNRIFKEFDDKAKAATKSVNELKNARANLFGTDDIKQAELYMRALGGIENVSKLTKDKQAELNAILTAALDAYRALGKTAPEQMRRVWAATADLAIQTEAYAHGIGHLHESLEELDGGFVSFVQRMNELEGGFIDSVKAAKELDAATLSLKPSMKDVAHLLVDWRQQLSELSAAFAHLSQVAGGSLGTIVGAFGTVTNAMNTAKSGWDSFSGGLKNFKADNLLAGIAGITTGILGIVSAAVAAFNAIKNLFSGGEEGTMVNPARDAFLSQFGGAGTGVGSGFHTLAARLAELGKSHLFEMLRSADTMAEFEEAVRLINEALGQTVPAANAAGQAVNQFATSGTNASQQVSSGLQATNQDIRRTHDEVLNLDRVFERLGGRTGIIGDEFGDLSVVVQNSARAMHSLAGQASHAVSALSRIPTTINIGVRYKAEGFSNLRGFAGGTDGRFLNFGSGMPAMLHGREAVVRQDETGDLASRIASHLGERTADVHLHITALDARSILDRADDIAEAVVMAGTHRGKQHRLRGAVGL